MTSPPPQAPDLPDELEEIIWNELPDRIRQGPLHNEMTEACRAIARACFSAGRTPLLAEIERLKNDAEQLKADKQLAEDLSVSALDEIARLKVENDQWAQDAEGSARANNGRILELMRERDELRAQLEAARKALGQIAEWFGELRAREFFFIARKALQDTARAEKP